MLFPHNFSDAILLMQDQLYNMYANLYATLSLKNEHNEQVITEREVVAGSHELGKDFKDGTVSNITVEL